MLNHLLQALCFQAPTSQLLIRLCFSNMIVLLAIKNRHCYCIWHLLKSTSSIISGFGYRESYRLQECLVSLQISNIYYVNIMLYLHFGRLQQMIP